MSAEKLVWANGELAWLFALLGCLIVGVLLYFQWKKRVAHRIGDGPLVELMTHSSSRVGQWTRWTLFILAVGLLILAVMRPKHGTREAELTNQGIDVVIAIDMSKSMLVEDTADGSRLRSAVNLASKILSELKGGRVALVPFAGTAYTQTPLTNDFDAVKTYLRQLRVSDVPIGGTRIGLAIRHALKAFDPGRGEGSKDGDESEPAQVQGSHHKAIILVTDGEDHDEQAVEAAREARKQNVRIYAVGFGSGMSTGRIPITTDLLGGDDDSMDALVEKDSAAGDELAGTKRVGWVKDAEGNYVSSDLNVALITELADNSMDGKAFVYDPQSDISKQITTKINELEGIELERRREDLAEDRFQFLLIPALLLLFAEALIPTRRRRKRRAA
jgi:Ca-activated chloride channel family protein